MKTKTKKTTAKTESPAAMDKRLGPSREIVRWKPKSKKRRIAVLSCSHEYSRMTSGKRKTMRCRACKRGAPKKGARVAAKATKKAA